MLIFFKKNYKLKCFKEISINIKNNKIFAIGSYYMLWAYQAGCSYGNEPPGAIQDVPK